MLGVAAAGSGSVRTKSFGTNMSNRGAITTTAERVWAYFQHHGL